MYLSSVDFKQENFPTRDRFPFNIKVFQKTGSIEFLSPVTFLVGKNGCGKSALLDALARRCGLLPWGGSKIHKVHNNPYETQLANYITVNSVTRHPYGFYFRAEVFFNFAGSLDDIILDDPARDKYFGGGSLNALSHGEGFLAFFKGYSFQLDGLYLMDEPEAALSPENQVEFIRIIRDSLNGTNKQYIIATHSPIVLGCPDAQILSLDHSPVRAIGYTDTRHYNFYKEFLNDPGRFLQAAEEPTCEAVSAHDES